MGIDVSIILISYNKYPENLLTLYSLENQTYPHSKMEVILIDDCSTDNTCSLRNYRAGFSFKYISSPANLGRAGAKNLGIREAQGEIIIFLDAEVMVAPDFVTNHRRHFNDQKELAVSGTSNHFTTFSALNPEFSKRQVRKLHSLINDDPLVMEKFSKIIGVSTNKIKNLKRFLRYTGKNTKVIFLLSKEDISDGFYKKLSYSNPSFSEVLSRYGNSLRGYHLAWTFFITRNISVRKEILKNVGFFNEEFQGWGYEDWELGYRLFKNGVKIIEDSEIYSYHQEHPFSLKNRKKEQMENYLKFINLHPDLEVNALVLGILIKKGFNEVNKIIDDFYFLKESRPEQYLFLEDFFKKLTIQIPFLLAQGKEIEKNLLVEAGLTSFQEKIKAEVETVRATGKYDSLVSAFDLLISL